MVFLRSALHTLAFTLTYLAGQEKNSKLQFSRIFTLTDDGLKIDKKNTKKLKTLDSSLDPDIVFNKQMKTAECFACLVIT